MDLPAFLDPRRLTRAVPDDDPHWRLAAICPTAPDPDAWFPEGGDSGHAAKATCAVCPALDPCRREGYGGRLPDGEPLQGIWGGLTELERAILGLYGWQPDQPLPALDPSWVTVATAADEVGVTRQAIGGWARTGQIDSAETVGDNGEPWRLVDLDQVRARAARAPGRDLDDVEAA